MQFSGLVGNDTQGAVWLQEFENIDLDCFIGAVK